MRKLLALTVFVSLLAISVPAHVSLIEGAHANKTGQQNFRLEKVGGNVYMLVGEGGNIGVSYGADGLLTIDTQFERFVPQIKAELKKLGSDTPKFIFNTHFHGDHTGGNVLFGQDAIILAQENVRNRLLSPVDRSGNARTPTPKAGLPTITYEKQSSIYFNDEEIRAIHYNPAHTDGDTVVFFTKSNVVHIGDQFFVGRFPFVDLASGGSVEGLLKNIGQLIQIIPADAKIIPGHGSLATIDDLRDYNNMLIETTLIVRKAMKEGKTLEEIKKAGFPEKYQVFAPQNAFINQDAWIETIYRSYSVPMDKPA